MFEIKKEKFDFLEVDKITFKREDKNDTPTDKGVIVVLIICLVALFFYLLFKFLKKEKNEKLNEEKNQYLEQIGILSMLKISEAKKIKSLEWFNRHLPILIRFIFVTILGVYDWICWFLLSLHSSTSTTNILKDITVYNATLLTLFLCLAFLFQGKLWKLEDLILYMNNEINDKVFHYYFSKMDKRKDSECFYEEDILKCKIRIEEIDKELKSNNFIPNISSRKRMKL